VHLDKRLVMSDGGEVLTVGREGALCNGIAAPGAPLLCFRVNVPDGYLFATHGHRVLIHGRPRYRLYLGALLKRAHVLPPQLHPSHRRHVLW
jgi:hypothetical protein